MKRTAWIAGIGAAVLAAGGLALAKRPAQRPDGGRGPLPVGASAPDVSGQDQQGRACTAARRAGHRAVYFYPRTHTGCTPRLSLRDAGSATPRRGEHLRRPSDDAGPTRACRGAPHPFPLIADGELRADAFGVSAWGITARVSPHRPAGKVAKVTATWTRGARRRGAARRAPAAARQLTDAVSREETAPLLASGAQATRTSSTRTRERATPVARGAPLRRPRRDPSGLTVLWCTASWTRWHWDDVARWWRPPGTRWWRRHARLGDSDRVGPGGTITSPIRRDLDVLVAHMAPARLAVVGHSMGHVSCCSPARTGARRAPGLLEGWGRSTSGDAPWNGEGRLADCEERATQPTAVVADDAASAGLSHPPCPGRVVSRAARLVAQGADGELRGLRSLHRTGPDAVLLAASGASAEHPCPTLFVGGGESGWHPPDEDERLGWIAGARRVELPGAGHMMHWAAPAELGAILVRFLAGDDG